jgi:hypothetical protein
MTVTGEREKVLFLNQADRNIEQLSAFFVNGQDCSIMACQSD